jgi:HAD superfamily hydrolase (TIGR01509 family)
MLAIRAVVFDFDGLVLDTEVPVYAAWCAAFEAHGAVPPTLEEWAAEIGTAGGLDLEAWLVERATRPVDIDAVQLARRAHRDELLEHEQVRAGVESWIDEAEAAGFGVSIASSSPSEWVVEHLERLALRHRFTHVVTAGGALRAKPAPDTYVEACVRLGVDPHAALAVEDSPNGIAAAKAAGLTCVTVPNTMTEGLDLSAADLRLTSLADHTLADVLAQLG